jgi:hypothetical protein
LEKTTVLKEYVEYVYDNLGRTLEGLTVEEARWKPMPESNDVAYILRHMAKISKHLLPSVMGGDTVTAWKSDYEKIDHGIAEMFGDLWEGRDKVLEEFNGLTDTDLDAVISLWGGKKPRKFGLFLLLSELVHHGGQVAYFRGAMRRLKEKKQL